MDDIVSHDLGYLLVGHGTRDLIGQGEFREVVRLVADRVPRPVVGAFLELADPTIAQGLRELRQRGVKRVFVVPLLLFSAGHAKQDVPGEVAQAAANLGMEIIGQSGALELHPKLLELSRLRFGEAGSAGYDLSGTRLLMVGRGGSDPAALAMMRRYTQALADSLGVVGETAFAALANPSVEHALQSLAASGAKQVVVQPHLLFAGEVLQTVRRRVIEVQATSPHIQWLVSKPLGPHPLLIEAIVQKLGEQ